MCSNQSGTRYNKPILAFKQGHMRTTFSLILALENFFFNPVSSLSINIYSHNENLAQVTCHDVYNHVPSSTG